jgi:hypothetical protein
MRAFNFKGASEILGRIPPIAGPSISFKGVLRKSLDKIPFQEEAYC